MSLTTHTENPEGSTPARHALQIQRITWIGLLVNLFLAMVKFMVGFMGSSQAVIADAVHSLSDMTTDIAVLLGVRFWTAPADEDHPYGHWRIETLVTAVIGISLAAVALGIGYKSLSTMREVHLKQPGWIAIAGVMFSMLIKELLYHWTLAVGKSSKSTAVTANAWHHRSDAVSSIPALLAVAAAAFNPDWVFIDHVGALLVSLIILKVSWDIISPAFSELTDQGASQKEREKIRSIALETNHVERVHAVRTRKHGSGLFIDLHVQVPGDMSVRKGHEVCEIVKKQLIDKGPGILDVVVHLEPSD